MWIITAWKHIFRRVLRSDAYPTVWMRLTMVCFGKAVNRMGILRLTVWKMRALTVKWKQ
jgi:hypothetical protein